MWRAETIVYLGQPFAPLGGADPEPGHEPRTVSRSSAPSRRSRRRSEASGVPVSKLRSSVSTKELTAVGQARGINPLMEIAVEASGRTRAELAAEALAARVVEGVSSFVSQKVELLESQVAVSSSQLEAVTARIQTAQRQQDALIWDRVDPARPAPPAEREPQLGDRPPTRSARPYGTTSTRHASSSISPRASSRAGSWSRLAASRRRLAPAAPRSPRRRARRPPRRGCRGASPRSVRRVAGERPPRADARREEGRGRRPRVRRGAARRGDARGHARARRPRLRRRRRLARDATAERAAATGDLAWRFSDTRRTAASAPRSSPATGARSMRASTSPA